MVATGIEHRYLMVDPSAGSQELIAPLRDLCSVSVERLVDIGGDCAWWGYGRGEDGGDRDVLVGVEYKKFADLLDSIRYGRLAATQIPRMVETYDVRYLVIEGLWRCGERGELLTYNYGKWDVYAPGKMRPVNFAYVDNFLTSLEEIGGFRVRKTGSGSETVQVVHNLFRYWGKKWHEHESLGFGGGIGGWKVATEVGAKVDYAWKALAELPGVGVDKAQAISKAYGRDMLKAVVALAGVESLLGGHVPGIETVKDHRGRRVVGDKLLGSLRRVVREGY